MSPPELPPTGDSGGARAAAARAPLHAFPSVAVAVLNLRWRRPKKRATVRNPPSLPCKFLYHPSSPTSTPAIRVAGGPDPGPPWPDPAPPSLDPTVWRHPVRGWPPSPVSMAQAACRAGSMAKLTAGAGLAPGTIAGSAVAAGSHASRGGGRRLASSAGSRSWLRSWRCGGQLGRMSRLTMWLLRIWRLVPGLAVAALRHCHRSCRR